MPKLTKRVSHDFTLINNKMLRDCELGATERGVLITMLALPDNWKFSIKGLSKILPDGITKISTALKNLEAKHYLIRRRIYTNGKISDWEYIFSDERMPVSESNKTKESVPDPTKSSGNLDSDNLDSENLNQGMQNAENPSIYQINKNQENINQRNSDQESIHLSAKNESFQQLPMDPIDGFEKQNAEQVRFATEIFVKEQIEYEWYAEFFAETPDNSMDRSENTTFAGALSDVDMLVGIIVDTICSQKDTIRIGKEDMPHSVVESRFKRIEMKHIEYVLKCLMLSIKNIKNPKAYLTTALYNATFTCDFAESNELKNNDPALFIPKTYHDQEFRERFYGNTAFRG